MHPTISNYILMGFHDTYKGFSNSDVSNIDSKYLIFYDTAQNVLIPQIAN